MDGQEFRKPYQIGTTIRRADSRFTPSQWETAFLCNNVSHWLGATLESALHSINTLRPRQKTTVCRWHIKMYLARITDEKKQPRVIDLKKIHKNNFPCFTAEHRLSLATVVLHEQFSVWVNLDNCNIIEEKNNSSKYSKSQVSKLNWQYYIRVLRQTQQSRPNLLCKETLHKYLYDR